MTIDTTPSTYDASPRIRRFNAWFMNRFDGLLQRPLGRYKREIYADLPSTIVEIGPGVGANFRYYKPGTRVVAIEPNTMMHPMLRSRAENAQIDLVLKEGVAEATGLQSGSTEAVVSSWVLCTVVDPAAALAESKRILMSGGRLMVFEHVIGRNRIIRTIQRVTQKPWKRVWEGCELQRDTAAIIERAGFSAVNLRRVYIGRVAPTIATHIYGEAIK